MKPSRLDSRAGRALELQQLIFCLPHVARTIFNSSPHFLPSYDELAGRGAVVQLATSPSPTNRPSRTMSALHDNAVHTIGEDTPSLPTPSNNPPENPRAAAQQPTTAAAASSSSTSSSRNAPDSQRPCDTCRRRKLRCAREPGSDKCFLCTFHRRPCTFVEGPQQRRRQRRQNDASATDPTSTQREEDQSNSRREGSASNGDRASQGGDPFDNALVSPASPTSLLNRTLGLHKTTHALYVGPSSLQEPRLLNHQPTAPGASQEELTSYRRMDSSTVFVLRADHSSDEDKDILDSIEALVHPYGPALVALYFRIVHPTYPILHKGVWLEKYQRSYREFSPPLLAAVYALATDWWEYDPALTSKEKPPVDRLVAIATRTLNAAMEQPKLSAVQAGLLLLQRSGGDSWILSSQMVALSEELGLHVDCSPWDIPEWEKGVRRRLTWAVFMQDKWGALIHGRPSHISPLHWRAPHLEASDFPESAADEDDAEGSTEVEKGRSLFMHLARLTEIMSEAHSTLYTPSQDSYEQSTSSEAVLGLLEQVKPIALRLKHWASTLPPELGMDDVRTRKLCSNGYLHLSYYATEIMIHRQIVRRLGGDISEHLRSICRDAAQTRLEHAMAFVEKLRPEHLQSFWWFAAPKSLALIGVFAATLSITSASDEEAVAFKQKLDDFHWRLKVRSRGSNFIVIALDEMEKSLLRLSM
ncbi:fungal-specific transcription factor domain-containing protein [Stachybotrys elegans]|uniref:Fungal-specific transcription factor domain-containing protein n=1 Tax=Stachybotrys elegans TaxID=80388 RepID=A0A8K0SWI6_9HYPO|nr:fungal-specific transcription factor domain-containing protein [Stachybotrys elegans]